MLLHLDPAVGGTFNLKLTKPLPQLQPVPPGGTCQQGNPADSAHVKHVKILSNRLTRFWGHPMYIAADVLLPQGYDDPSNAHVRYPVIWHQTHFPSDNPLGFHENLDNAFSRWVSTAAPRVIVVEIRHENPYFDDSYAVNSANLGPYGDAITKELMPVVYNRFRAINASWARTITGGSTGGWETIAQQVFYPTLYSGAWVFYPDPVDFHFHQAIDVYDDPNAYYHLHEWLQVSRPAARETSGDTIWAMAQENHWELALGDHGRSGLGQWDIWQAVYGPEGPGGYSAPIWDKVSGKIDHAVAQAWMPMDIDHYLMTNWSTIGPDLTGRINFFVGTEDTFFLNDAVQMLQQNVAKLANPPANFTFTYGLNEPHGWSPYTTQQLIVIMAEYMAGLAPGGTSTSAWLGRGVQAVQPARGLVQPPGPVLSRTANSPVTHR
jgi:Putative esterase